MDDWEGFIDGCEDEEYVMCSLVIDGEEQPGAGIRAKGNTSLSSVAAHGNDRYSFKVEFDHYDSSLSYYGLDKLNLNNIIQDNTYMKDYLSYRLMAAAGAAAGSPPAPAAETPGAAAALDAAAEPRPGRQALRAAPRRASAPDKPRQSPYGRARAALLSRYN